MTHESPHVQVTNAIIYSIWNISASCEEHRMKYLKKNLDVAKQRKLSGERRR